MRFLLISIILVTLTHCQTKSDHGFLIPYPEDFESIKGVKDYLESPFVTAGDRVYMVGWQDGTFPDLGWHVKGEMGGIWDHPIKLMDGFTLQINSWCLDSAYEFINYPFFNVHRYENKNLQLNVDRLQFVPDGEEGMVIQYLVENNSEDQQDLEVTFTGMIDLSPVWLSERQGISDGSDIVMWDGEGRHVIAKDSSNNWYAIFGSDGFSFDQSGLCNFQRSGKGKNASIKKVVVVSSGEKKVLNFFISGSSTSLSKAKKTYGYLEKNYWSLFESKKARYEEIGETNQLQTGDSSVDQMFQWIKYNTDWLVRDVPEQGRAVSAGIPDYPWWFGTDNGYTLQGMLAAGMHEEALNTIELIIELSREVNNNSGKIMHEASTNGVVFNPGNLNTTPNFIYALWKAYEWTGDTTLIEKYYSDIIRGIDWIESQDKDGNGYPDGPGMMEIPGLHTEMIDVVSYQYAAYRSVANFARVAGDTEKASEYDKKASQLRQKINSEWWVEEFNSFADFRSDKATAMELTKAAITRADTINKPWSVDELIKTRNKISVMNPKGTQGYVVHRNWVVNTPMEVGAADPDKALEALETAKNYRSRFGMFVTGIDRDESQEKAEKWEVFSYVGAVMTLPTGVQAIAEANYGNVNESYEYLKMLENSFSYALPGSMYEVSPDFGMITQAWNIYAVATPVVEKYFGIQPRAWKKEVLIEPNLPSDWTDVSLKNIRVGDNLISIDIDGETVSITQQKNWRIIYRGKGKEQVSTENKLRIEG